MVQRMTENIAIKQYYQTQPIDLVSSYIVLLYALCETAQHGSAVGYSKRKNAIPWVEDFVSYVSMSVRCWLIVLDAGGFCFSSSIELSGNQFPPYFVKRLEWQSWISWQQKGIMQSIAFYHFIPFVRVSDYT